MKRRPTVLNYLDIELSGEERMIQQTVREFCDQEVQPIIRQCFEAGAFPRELVPRMGELGLFGSTLPEFGAGLNPTSYGLICQELERADTGLRSFVSVQSSLCMFPLYSFGSDEQKQKYLPKMAKGELVGCFGLTEPEHGSDPASMETRAERDGQGWVLNGTKMWITNGSVADLAIIWARMGDNITGFVVEAGTPGLATSDIKDKLSLRASVTSELSLSDVKLPGSAQLPGATSLGAALRCLNEARYGIVWGAVGAAMACYETALEYARLRKQFDRPIAAFQLTQEKLVDMLSSVTQGQLLALQLGRLKDSGRARPQQVSLGKRANVAMALQVARTARSILGANGISLEHPVFRHMVNLESVYTYEGTHEIHTLVIGQDVTGHAAFT
jgi:glutaryl-CoA dehydrogenase